MINQSTEGNHTIKAKTFNVLEIIDDKVDNKQNL